MKQTLGPALEAVIRERVRQLRLHGVDEHPPEAWVSVLTAEGIDFAIAAGAGDREGMRREAIHIAAVGVAIYEAIERGST